MKRWTIVDGVVPQDVVPLPWRRGQQGVGSERLAGLVDVVIAARLERPVGQHEVELTGEAVALQDVGHSGAGGFVHFEKGHVVLSGALSNGIGEPAFQRPGRQQSGVDVTKVVRGKTQLLDGSSLVRFVTADKTGTTDHFGNPTSYTANSSTTTASNNPGHIWRRSLPV